jgi:hypothetical protein
MGKENRREHREFTGEYLRPSGFQRAEINPVRSYNDCTL